MKEIISRKVSHIMRAPPSLIFSSTDTVSKFLGSLNRLGFYEALVTFRNRMGIVTARDVLDVIHPERTLLGAVARRISSISPEATVLEAANLMVSTGVRAVPVMENREVIGVVSNVDVTNLMMESPMFRETPCGEAARPPAASVNVNERISTARRLMREHDVEGLPVTNRSGGLEGVITAKKIVFTFLIPEEAVTEGEFVGESVRNWDIPVKNFMDVNPLVAGEEEPLIRLVEDFRKFGKELCIVKMRAGSLNVVTPTEIVTLLLAFKIKRHLHIRLLGLPESGDFIGMETIQNKVARVFSRGLTFHSDLEEVVIDVKRRRQSGGRTLYQIRSKIYSPTKLILITAHGWCLAEAFDNLCERLNRALRKSKRRRPSP